LVGATRPNPTEREGDELDAHLVECSATGDGGATPHIAP
jgi:hypothetical protein